MASRSEKRRSEVCLGGWSSEEARQSKRITLIIFPFLIQMFCMCFQPVRFSAWSPQHPGRFSTLMLQRPSSRSSAFVWRGTWSGSESDQRYSFPFICEKPLPNSECTALCISQNCLDSCNFICTCRALLSKHIRRRPRVPRSPQLHN